MQAEETIIRELTDRFDFLKDSVQIARERRVSVTVPRDQFNAVIEHMVHSMGFSILLTITGLDEVEVFSVIYHISRDNSVIVNLKVSLPKDKAAVDSVTKYFPVAELYEREIEDLLGISVQGLAPGRRYPLPDDWPADQHPLRKDWHPAEENQAE